MSNAAARETRAVLLDFDVDQLQALDRFWPAVGYASRRAAVRAAVAQMLAAHAASEQLDRRRRAEPNQWASRGLTHTGDGWGRGRSRRI